LPKQVYTDDSKNVSVELNQGPFLDEVTSSKILSVGDTESGKPITLQIQQDYDGDQFIEIELLAAGVIISGEVKQRQKITVPTLYYRWNCCFKTSGHHEMFLIFRLVNPSDIIELGVVEHRVRVTKLDHMTQRQVWLIASILTIISGIFGVIQVVSKLGMGGKLPPSS
jgi:hypothetical protein